MEEKSHVSILSSSTRIIVICTTIGLLIGVGLSYATLPRQDTSELENKLAQLTDDNRT